MGILTRKQVASGWKPQVKTERVDVQNGQYVYVREVAGGSDSRIASWQIDKPPTVRELVVMGACEEDGKRIFQDGDEELLEEWPLTTLQKIADAFIHLNGMDQQEELEKNSSGTPSGDSPSS